MGQSILIVVLTSFITLTPEGLWGFGDISQESHHEKHDYLEDRRVLQQSRRWSPLFDAQGDRRRVKVLTLDGGGVRGIITAKVLENLETQLRFYIGPQATLAGSFDLIAGTSTGGIITLGLTQPSIISNMPLRQAQDMTNLYKEFSHKIFRCPWYRKPLKSMRSLIWRSKYNSTPFKRILHEMAPSERLSQCCTNVMIVSVNAHNGCTRLFRSYTAQYNLEEDFLIKDLCFATSAAPTYFKRAKIAPFPYLGTDDESKLLHLVDGGLSANNPALIAFAEACNLFPERGIDLISIGTGALSSNISQWQRDSLIRERGALAWAKPTVDMLLHGSTEMVHNSLLRLSGVSEDSPLRYHRFQHTMLPQQLKPLDQEKNIEALESESPFCLHDPKDAFLAPLKDEHDYRGLFRPDIQTLQLRSVVKEFFGG